MRNELLLWLGYQIDTMSMTIPIPQRKLDEAVHECALWLNRMKVKKSMVQSLIGRLSTLTHSWICRACQEILGLYIVYFM